jgi:hypothetical protein
VLERVDLRGDRLVREPQPGRGRVQAALARDQPEVQQVVVVEPFRARTLCRENLHINL